MWMQKETSKKELCSTEPNTVALNNWQDMKPTLSIYVKLLYKKSSSKLSTVLLSNLLLSYIFTVHNMFLIRELA